MYTEKLLKGEVEESDESQTTDNQVYHLECLLDRSCNWTTWDVLRMAFAAGLSGVAIDLIYFLRIDARNIAKVTQAIIVRASNSLDVGREAGNAAETEVCWEFISKLQKIYRSRIVFDDR